MKYARILPNKFGKTIILIGLWFHIFYVGVILIDQFGKSIPIPLILMLIATIPMTIGYVYLRKKPNMNWAVFFIFAGLILTQFLIGILFIIGEIATIYTFRANREAVRKSRVNL